MPRARSQYAWHMNSIDISPLFQKIKDAGIVLRLSEGQLKLQVPKDFAGTDIIQEIRSRKQELMDYISLVQEEDVQDNQPASVQQGSSYEVFYHQKKEYLRFLILGEQAFNLNIVIPFVNLDRQAFEKTIYSIFQRHESLRTTFSMADGEVRQHIHDMASFQVPICYSSLVDDPDREAAGEKLTTEAANKRFNFEKEPLADLQMVHYTTDTHYLSLTIHHASCDVTSLGIIMDEISTIYDAYSRGEPNPLPAPQFHYKDYASWVNSQLEGPAGNAARAFYTSKIGGSISREYAGCSYPSYRRQMQLELEQALGKGNSQCFPEALGSIVNLYPRPGASYKDFVMGPVLGRAKELAAERNVSLYMLLSAAFVLAMCKVNGKRISRFYMPFSTRTAKEFEGTVGWLTSEVIVSIDVDEEQAVMDFISGLADAVLETSAHRLYPHEAIMKDLDAPLHVLAPLFLNFIYIPDKVITDFTPTHYEEGSGHFDFRSEAREYVNGIKTWTLTAVNRLSI
jgi:hypothetical protein